MSRLKTEIKKTIILFKAIFFGIGCILFLFSSMLLVHEIRDLLIDGIEGVLPIDAPDSERQINVLKNGFMLLWIMGLVIISLLMINFFKDWYKDYKKEEDNN